MSYQQNRNYNNSYRDSGQQDWRREAKAYADNQPNRYNNQRNNYKSKQNYQQTRPPRDPLQAPIRDYRNDNAGSRPHFNQIKVKPKNESEYKRSREFARKKAEDFPKGIQVELRMNMSTNELLKLIQDELKNLGMNIESEHLKFTQKSNIEIIIWAKDLPMLQTVYNGLLMLKCKQDSNINNVEFFYEQFDPSKIERLKDSLMKQYNKQLYHHENQFKSVERELKETVDEELKKSLETRLDLYQRQQKVFENFFYGLLQKLTSYLDPQVRATKKDRQIHYEINQIKLEFEQECLKFETKLPLYAFKDEILNELPNYQVFIICAETGSGKSTQIPQYLAQSNQLQGKIVCTQPRRIAAMSLAKQVSKEVIDKKLGQSVGFSIGQHERISKKTKIVYMTDSKFLNEILTDKTLSSYSCVIIDEAHERGIYTELLISIMRKNLAEIKDFKLIISSATINPQIFIDYFKEFKLKHWTFPGQSYPVRVEYCPVYEEVAVSEQTNDDSDADDFAEVYEHVPPIKNEEEQDEDYIRACVDKALQIIEETPQDSTGHILVFLTGVNEIEKACIDFQNFLYDPDRFLVLQLNGSMNPDEQSDVFKEFYNKDGKQVRKIIFSTNVAETSVTLPSVKYIIDSGREKQTEYDEKSEISELKVQKISRSSSDQRKGRAGRTVAGVCYRLYSERDYQHMLPMQKPELLRINLMKSMLKLADLRVKDVLNFPYVERPNEDKLKTAYENLLRMNALKKQTNESDEVEITDVGRLISRLPFEPNICMLIVYALKFDDSILLECITLASLLSQQNLFYQTSLEDEKHEINLWRLYFSDQSGDAFTYLNIINKYLNIQAPDRDNWCRERGLNYRLMHTIINQIHDAVSIVTKSKITENALNEILKFSNEAEREFYALKLESDKNNRLKMTKVSTPNTQTQLKTDEITKSKLKRIIYECFKETNLCHYTGLSGIYYLDRLKKFIRIYPTQTYRVLNTYPQFVTFEHMFLTNNEYLVSVQDASDYCLIEGNPQVVSWLNIFDVIQINNIGNALIRRIIGKQAKNLKRIENDIKEKYLTECLIHVDDTTSTLKAIVAKDKCSLIKEHLKRVVDNEKIFLSKKQSNILADNMILSIGSGGVIRNFKELNTKNYLNYEVKLQVCWDRRTKLDKAYVHFSNNSNFDLIQSILNSNFYYFKINDKLISVKSTRQSPREIQLTGLTADIDQNDIKRELEDKLNGCSVDRVNFVLSKPFETSKEQFRVLRNSLTKIVEASGAGPFTIFFNGLRNGVPLPSNSRYSVRIEPKCHTNLRSLAEFLNNPVNTNSISPNLRCVFHIRISLNMKIFNVLNNSLNSLIKCFQNEASNDFSIDISTRFTNELTIELASSKLDLLERKLELIRNEVNFKIIDVNHYGQELIGKLQTKLFSKHLKDIMKDTLTFIEYDKLTKTIKVFGNAENIVQANQRLIKLLNEAKDKVAKEISFNGQISIVNMVKYLFDKYGRNFEGIFPQKHDEKNKKLPRTQIITFDINENLIRFHGNDQEYKALINALQLMLEEVKNDQESESFKKCEYPSCVSAQNFGTKLHKLSLCGHYLCNLCFDKILDQSQVPVSCPKCVPERSQNVAIEDILDNPSLILSLAESKTKNIQPDDLIEFTTEQQLFNLIWKSAHNFSEENKQQYIKCQSKTCLRIIQKEANASATLCYNCLAKNL